MIPVAACLEIPVKTGPGPYAQTGYSIGNKGIPPLLQCAFAGVDYAFSMNMVENPIWIIVGNELSHSATDVDERNNEMRVIKGTC